MAWRREVEHDLTLQEGCEDVADPRPRKAASPMINISDHSAVPLPPSDPILGNCRASVSRRLSRTSALPPLNIDPLSPLPLADAAKPTPAVRFVYFILASRPYAHETINRNIRTLQRPGALEAVGSNESNLFLLHSDAKMSDANTELLKSRVTKRPDMYWLRKNRFVMWSGFSMVAAQLDVMGSLVARRLGFDTLITLSDADLTLRVDGEIRAFFAKYPGRSIMSIVQRHRDTRRYKLHENFRRYCWFECDKGSAFLVASPNGEQLDGMKVRVLRCMRAMRVACHPVSPLTTHLSRQHTGHRQAKVLLVALRSHRIHALKAAMPKLQAARGLPRLTMGLTTQIARPSYRQLTIGPACCRRDGAYVAAGRGCVADDCGQLAV